MPVIKEYSSRGLSVGPVRISDAPMSDGGVGVATRRLGESIMGLGEALDKRAVQAEVSDLNAKMATAQEKFSSDWKETLRTATPGDQTLAENFIKKFDEEMGPIGDSFSTRTAKEQFRTSYARLRGHFQTNALAGQAELAGIKAKDDYMKVRDGLSSSLLNDPSSFEISSFNHDQAIDNLVNSGLLPKHTSDELKREGKQALAKSAIRGWSKLDPEGAKEQLTSGQWDEHLTGDLKNQLLGEAEQELRAKDIEAERKIRESERLKREQQNLTQNKFLEKMAKNQLSTRDILDSDLEAFGQGSKHQFLQMLETDAKAGGNIRTDPQVMMSAFDRIHAPDSDPNKIRDENELNKLFGRGLSMESLNQLRAEMQGKKTAEGEVEAELKKGLMNIAKGTLTRSNPLTGMPDPIGDTQYQKFMSFFLTEYQAQRRQGKTFIQLLSPESPDYLGNHIRRFTRTQQQMMQDLIRMNAPVEEDDLTAFDSVGDMKPVDDKIRKQGETIEQWKKRVKGN